MPVILFMEVALGGDQVDAQTATGLVCISDCPTCPMICASPPPVLFLSPPPRPEQPFIQYPPPESYYINQPPAPPSPSTTSYYLATPPPSLTYVDIPSPPLPPNVDPRGYSYPYYMFYGSNASHNSLPTSFSFFLVFLIFFSHVLYLC
ncbi:hypothetical protein IFM89_002188 [Coptis chinensis]|uniref:Uncharacterized protein n=1 Tax=Coptis chinensis TaxID=261450 RepID=A0A835M171_9MAGN|nr:hypothetical protein IFM89_002188 [Coptis chinensis]